MVRRLDLSPRDAAALTAYNREVFDRFARRVRRLPLKAAMRRRGIGHESLFATLVHILNVQEVWLVHVAHRHATEAQLDALFRDARRHPTSWAGFDEYSRRVWAGVEEMARGLTARKLGRRVKAFWMPGEYTVRDAFYQATFEEAHHVGEIIGALWQDDLRPPDMTWIDVGRAPRPRRQRRRR